MGDARVMVPLDMPDNLVEVILALAKEAVKTFDVDRAGADAAKFMKEKLDASYAPHWHVVVGNSFGSNVVHESRCFIYFYLGSRAFLVFKMGQ